MRSKKSEIAYTLVLVISIVLIYITYQTAFANVTISQVMEKKEVFFLSFDTYIYMAVGLLLLGFTVYLHMHLAAYKVGRVFAAYLSFITISICMVAITNYQYAICNVFIWIFAFGSNIFLFYSIGYITLLSHKAFFKCFLYILCIATIVFIGMYIYSINTSYIFFIIFRDEIVLADYILTIAITIICMLKGYSGSTIYSKRQIKFLSMGLLFGVLVFILMRLMPMLAVVKIPENTEEIVVSYQIDMVGGNQDIYPIIVFTGMAIVMLYILIKREYLTIDENRELWRYLLSVIYVIISNTYFMIVMSVEIRHFILFNIILCTPLILFNHQIWQKKEKEYDNNLIEVLEEERQRISVFLHDEVLQDLIALLHSITAEEAKEHLSALISEIRSVSQDLYPTIVEDIGLEQALNVFIEELQADYNIDVIYKYEYPQGILPNGISLVIYRTIKELVNNAIKHSGCRSILVMLQEGDSTMECIVIDDGCGFEIPENMELLKSPHMGLYTVKKQIADLKGNMRITSDKTGSKFEISIPVRC